MVKAIFFDIDGTLVSFNTHKVSDAVCQAIKQLREKGIKVFIASGRSGSELAVIDGIEFDGYIVLNGSHCYTAAGEDIYKKYIPKEDVSRLVKWLKTSDIPFGFVYDDGAFVNRVNDRVKEIARLVELEAPSVEPEENALGKDILQIMGYFEEGQEPDLFNDVLKNCDQMRWNPYFTDIIAKGNSKSGGIDYVLKYYGIDLKDTMAFGDGGNDILMLKHVAIGVAMGNATDHIKAVADYTTTSVDDDGIVFALKHFGIL